MKYTRNILVTGGAGFIGSHVVRHFVTHHPDYRIVNLDALTYAGNLENLGDVESASNYTFVRADITDEAAVGAVFREHQIDSVIHLAAESHVDRSISGPMAFVKTNVIGTVVLLQAAKAFWKERARHPKHLTAGSGAEPGHLFYHVSTDEVYGTLGDTGLFTEETPYDPHSPYSASKASSDHFVRAYHDTYKLPVVISNCSNNYGPNQFPEKLIPLCINNIKHGKPLPVYGQGENTRDWLYVEDHAAAIDRIFHGGRTGETYNIGGFNERKNIELVRLLCRVTDRLLKREESTSEKLITFVTDRPGHDLRYAIDSSKVRNELGWKPSVTLEEGLEKTVKWYLENEGWLEHVTSGAYQSYYEQQYSR